MQHATGAPCSSKPREMRDEKGYKEMRSEKGTRERNAETENEKKAVGVLLRKSGWDDRRGERIEGQIDGGRRAERGGGEKNIAEILALARQCVYNRRRQGKRREEI